MNSNAQAIISNPSLQYSNLPAFQSLKNIINLVSNQFPVPLALQFRRWTFPRNAGLTPIVLLSESQSFCYLLIRSVFEGMGRSKARWPVMLPPFSPSMSI